MREHMSEVNPRAAVPALAVRTHNSGVHSILSPRGLNSTSERSWLLLALYQVTHWAIKPRNGTGVDIAIVVDIYVTVGRRHGTLLRCITGEQVDGISKNIEP